MIMTGKFGMYYCVFSPSHSGFTIDNSTGSLVLNDVTDDAAGTYRCAKPLGAPMLFTYSDSAQLIYLGPGTR